MTGRYAASRRAETTFFKLFSLLGQASIAPDEKGVLTVPGLTELNGQPKEWHEVAPLVWRESHGPEQVAVKMDGDRVQMLSADEVGGILVLLPVPWQQSGAWILPVVGRRERDPGVDGPGVADRGVAQARRGTPLALSPRELQIYRFARVVALVDVVFLLGWMGIVSAGNAISRPTTVVSTCGSTCSICSGSSALSVRSWRLEWLAGDRRQARLEGDDLERRAGGLVRGGFVVRVRLQPHPLHAEVLTYRTGFLSLVPRTRRAPLRLRSRTECVRQSRTAPTRRRGS